MARVAIIDDAKDNLELFAFILNRPSDEFVTFQDGREFLARFHRNDYQLIMLDLIMPEIGGFEVFARIREEDEDVPVVAITARAHESEKERAIQAGFCDYFVKPIFEIERFRQTVYSHIGECANPPRDAPDAA